MRVYPTHARLGHGPGMYNCVRMGHHRAAGRCAEGLLVNPRRACAARVTVVGLCVCLFVSVCLSVDDYSRTTGYEAAYERYQQL